jgi:PAS domain S-box-containing protein
MVPAFFRVGSSIALREQLWEQAQAAFFDSPIPPLFREQLFAYLSRYCAVPYCMARHAAFLQGIGPAHQDAGPTLEPAEVLALLRRPAPSDDEVEARLKALAARARAVEVWPEDARDPLGRSVFECAVHVFLRGSCHSRCLSELRRVLGGEGLEALIALLSFARVAHAWTEAQPELAFEDDLAAMLQEQPELGAWIEGYPTHVAAELGLSRRDAARGFVSEHEALRLSTEHLGAILEDSLNEIYVFDADTLRFTLANLGARQNLGYSLEELRQLTPVDLKPEFTDARFRELLEPLRSGVKTRLEFGTWHRRKDGSEYPVEVHLQLSSVVGSTAFVAIILDVTERRAQERAIADLEARALTILRTAAEAIITIEESGIIESVNPATLRLFGYTESELVGQNVRVLMAEPHAAAHDGYLARYLETGTPRIIGKGRELEARRKDGSVFPIRLSVGEARFEGRRLFTGILHDLSAQAEAERRLRALFQQRTSLAGICTLEGVVLDVNQASLDYVGGTRAEVVGRPFADSAWWSHDREQQAALRRGIQRAAAGEFVRFEANHRRSNGTLGTVDFSITPVRNAEGTLDVLLVESIDVTETRNLQAQLFQAQKMEAIGTLAGGIAHDFNNLLTSIRGSSEILIDHLEPEGRLARSATRILRAADRATALTTRLLGFSRKQITHRRALELNEVVRETRELFVGLLPEDVEVEDLLDPHDLYVRADASQLSQVLMNLLVNAGDAMPSGGNLRIATSRESVDAECAARLGVDSGSFIALRVTDTGEGMPAATCERIFDPFFTTKDPGKGTGLGLSTSLGIIREHDGAIEVASEPGQGACFTVWLPETHAPVAEVSVAAPGASPGPNSGQTLLLVEDDEIMRDLLVEVLEDDGYVVVATEGPEEALERGSEHEIDLVITDVVMPSMSGFALAQELRARRPWMRVLFMSGYTDQVLADRGELREDDPFLRKPFSNDALLEKIREVFDAAESAH